MAGSVNKVILVGNVGQEPEIRSTQDGKEIANFSIATSESWKDRNTGERKEKTEWHRISVFNDALVNVIKNYVHKGSKLYIEGQLQTRKWTDKSGVEKYTTEVVLQGYNGSLTMLDSKRDSQGGSSDYQGGSYSQPQQSFGANKSAPAQQEHALDDEIPF
jgi:single-strand DNA-binding protein